VEARYELSLDDYITALAFMRATPKKPRQGELPAWVSRLVLIFLLSIGPVGLVFAMGIAIRERGLNDIVRDARDNLVSMNALLPWFALVPLTFAGIVYSHMGRRMVVAFLAIVGIGILVLCALSLDTVPLRNPLYVLPWLLVGSAWWEAWRAYVVRTGYKRLWKGLQQLHGFRTMHWDDQGMTVASPAITESIRWTSVTAWREAPGLILVHISDFAYEIVPKRAFEDPQLLNSFRQALIDATTPGRRGFQVVDVKPPAAAPTITPRD
jgi:hypothetical protein